jgi:Thioesterase domain
MEAATRCWRQTRSKYQRRHTTLTSRLPSQAAASQILLHLQDKPYAIFGTCLGAIVAYEVTRRVAERKGAPLPIAIFPAAVSAPHLYAIAVMKLYVQHSVGASHGSVSPTAFKACRIECLLVATHFLFMLHRGCVTATCGML